MNGFSVSGLFCQNQATRDAMFQNIRCYLLARAMWQPQIDSRETIAEFCRLYFGPAAGDMQRYIDFLHDEYGHEKGRPDRADPARYFDERFVQEAESMLQSAEQKADTDELRQRIRVERLPVWKIILDRACSNVGRIYTFAREWSFRIDPEQKGWTENWDRTTDFTSWGTMAIDTHWTKQGERHRGAAWYGTHFDLPDSGGAPLALYFGAIDGHADIMLDGVKIAEQKLGLWQMWRQAFFRPLPRDLEPGRHTLVVRVEKPDQNAGIWMPVHIIDMSVPLAPELRRIANRFLEVARASKLTEVCEQGGPIEENYYPKIEFFLTHTECARGV
jgi:hypothetical protein